MSPGIFVIVVRARTIPSIKPEKIRFSCTEMCNFLRNAHYS